MVSTRRNKNRKRQAAARKSLEKLPIKSRRTRNGRAALRSAAPAAAETAEVAEAALPAEPDKPPRTPPAPDSPPVGIGVSRGRRKAAEATKIKITQGSYNMFSSVVHSAHHVPVRSPYPYACPTQGFVILKEPQARVKWSSAEVNALLLGVDKFGVGKWREVKDWKSRELQFRSTVQLKDKYRNLKKYNKLHKVARISTEPTTDQAGNRLYYAAEDETPSMIAKRFKLNVDDILKLNQQHSGITEVSKLQENTEIVLEAGEDMEVELSEQEQAPNAGKVAKKTKKKKGGGVRKRRARAKVDAKEAQESLKPREVTVATNPQSGYETGESKEVPDPPKRKVPPRQHMAVEDETPQQIADKYGVGVEDLLLANRVYENITAGALLYGGTPITLPPGAGDATGLQHAAQLGNESDDENAEGGGIVEEEDVDMDMGEDDEEGGEGWERGSSEDDEEGGDGGERGSGDESSGEEQAVPKRGRGKRWTQAEIKALKRGVEEFGEGMWAAIKRASNGVLGGRTPVNIKDKWRNLKKQQQRVEEMQNQNAKANRKKVAFSKDEVDLLLRLKTSGNFKGAQWSKILSLGSGTFNKCRSAEDLRSKWRNMQESLQANAEAPLKSFELLAAPTATPSGKGAGRQVFRGRQVRDAALKAATSGHVNIRLMETVTKVVHVFRGSRTRIPMTPSARDHLSEVLDDSSNGQLWKGTVVKVRSQTWEEYRGAPSVEYELYYSNDDETPREIAADNKVSLAALLKLNADRYKGITADSKLYAKTCLLLPVASEESDDGQSSSSAERSEASGEAFHSAAEICRRNGSRAKDAGHAGWRRAESKGQMGAEAEGAKRGGIFKGTALLLVGFGREEVFETVTTYISAEGTVLTSIFDCDPKKFSRFIFVLKKPVLTATTFYALAMGQVPVRKEYIDACLQKGALRPPRPFAFEPSEFIGKIKSLKHLNVKSLREWPGTEDGKALGAEDRVLRSTRKLVGIYCEDPEKQAKWVRIVEEAGARCCVGEKALRKALRSANDIDCIVFLTLGDMKSKFGEMVAAKFPKVKKVNKWWVVGSLFSQCPAKLNSFAS